MARNFSRRGRGVSLHIPKQGSGLSNSGERELNVQATNCHHRVSRVILFSIVADGGIIGRELVTSGYRTVEADLAPCRKPSIGVRNQVQNVPIAIRSCCCPGSIRAPAVGHADVIIPTGLDAYRNALVANSEAVVAVGGGAGTLSEVAFAWQFNRPIFAVGDVPWAHRLAACHT